MVTLTCRVTSARWSDCSCRYCTADRAIYAGQDALWSLYTGVVGAAGAVGYAHEWGHHIQHVMGVPEPETPDENTALETQADCIAGAWVRLAAQSGYLEYPADLGDPQPCWPRSPRRMLARRQPRCRSGLTRCCSATTADFPGATRSSRKRPSPRGSGGGTVTGGHAPQGWFLP